MPCIWSRTAQIVEAIELGLVGLGRGPCREEELHPAFVVECAKNFERIFLVADLLQFLPALVWGDELDGALGFGVVVAGQGSGVHFPVKARAVADGTDEQRGIFDKAVIRDEAQGAHFNVGRAIQRVHKKAVGSLIKGNGHRVDGEIPTAKVFLD